MNDQLDGEIRRLVALQVGRATMPRPEPDAVVTRGRAVRRRTVLGQLVIIAAVTAAAVPGALAVMNDLREEHVAASRRDARAAALTALYALADAGLYDGVGHAYFYGGTTRTGDDWIVELNRAVCVRGGIITCEPDKGRASMRVRKEDDGYVVTAARGRFTPAEWDALVGYTKAIRFRPRWGFPAPVLGSNYDIAALAVWLGNDLDGPPQNCYPQLRDANGRLAWIGSSFPQGPPRRQTGRFGLVVHFGAARGVPAGAQLFPSVRCVAGPPDPIDSKGRLWPARARAAIVRGLESAPGWEVAGRARLEEYLPASARPESRVTVRVPLVYRTVPRWFSTTLCGAVLVDAAGNTLGRGFESFASPWPPRGEPPYDLVGTISATVDPEGGDPRRIDVTCHPTG